MRKGSRYFQIKVYIKNNHRLGERVRDGFENDFGKNNVPTAYR